MTDRTRTRPLFQETQHFRQPLLWLPLFVSAGVIVYLASGRGGGGDPASTVALVLASLFLAVFIPFFWILRLETRIDDEGVHYRFSPLFRQLRTVPWNAVDRVWLRRYRPILEYGGWGIRGGLRGRGRAYNVRGNQGLQLLLVDGRKILLGTQRPSQLRVVVSGLQARGLVRVGDPDRE